MYKHIIFIIFGSMVFSNCTKDNVENTDVNLINNLGIDNWITEMKQGEVISVFSNISENEFYSNQVLYTDSANFKFVSSVSYNSLKIDDMIGLIDFSKSIRIAAEKLFFRNL